MELTIKDINLHLNGKYANKILLAVLYRLS